MANNYFKFKQFTIIQNLAAMKVGTDGVLLGAWANCTESKKILDIGTGTGLIALMLAQRCNAIIDAIDIEENACSEAKSNVTASPWQNRINVFHTSVQDFAKQADLKYDLIVSNPPFFDNSLKAGYNERSTARHTDSLSTSELFFSVKNLLNSNGKFAVVIPTDKMQQYYSNANNNKLQCNKLLCIKPTPTKQAKRLLLEFSFNQSELEENELIVEKYGRHKYSEEYKELTKDFYLKF